ncbi:MAG: zf-HC2 domain-containing protein [Clostridia bacterium]|nr:zf-HC2 domain-containing protein [Clostridia bacterium]
MKECIEYQSLIPEYLDGELDSSLCREFEAHIEECPSCKKTLEEMRLLLSDISESAYDAPAELKEGVMSRIAAENSAKKKKKLIRILGGVAACMVVAVGVTSVLPRIGSDIFNFTNTESADLNGVPEAEAPLIEDFTGGDSDAFDDLSEEDMVADELYESVKDNSFSQNEDMSIEAEDGNDDIGSVIDGAPLADSTYGDDYEINAGSTTQAPDDPAEKPSGDTESSDSEPSKGSDGVEEPVTTYSSYSEDIADIDYGALFMCRGAANLAELLEEEE